MSLSGLEARSRARGMLCRLALVVAPATLTCQSFTDSFEQKATRVGPELSVNQGCGYLRAKLHVEPDWVVCFEPWQKVRADKHGLASLHIPVERFQGPVITLELGFGATGSEGVLVTRHVLDSDPGLYLPDARIGKPHQKRSLVALVENSCGDEGYTHEIGARGVEAGNFRGAAGRLALAVRGARAVRANESVARLYTSKNTAAQHIQYTPEWLPPLADTDLQTKVSASLRVDGKSGSWLNLTFILDPSARPDPSLGYLVGYGLRSYRDVATTPISEAPAYSPQNSRHPTLLFEAVTKTGRALDVPNEYPYLRAAFLADGRVSNVEVVAFHEKRRMAAERCPAQVKRSPKPRTDLPGHVFDKPGMRRVKFESVVAIRAARTGALIAEKAFSEGPLRCGDTAASVQTTDDQVERWLREWTGLEPVMFGHATNGKWVR